MGKAAAMAPLNSSLTSKITLVLKLPESRRMHELT
jgi:hypothetical protein